MIFLVFFKVFAFVGLLGAILAQHGLQDDVKSLQNAFKGLQDASKSLQDGSTSLQNAPKSLQDAPKTPPESSQNRAFHNVFKYIPLSWAFLEPSCSTWPSKRLQSPPKRLQDPPESLQDTPTCLQPRASRPLPRAGSKSFLLRPSPFTKGGLAVVRPRRPSSIRQTTLVSQGRVQDRVKVLSSSKILPKEGLDQAPRLPPRAHPPLAKIADFPWFFQ